jgi:hypothetical protein
MLYEQLASALLTTKKPKREPASASSTNNVNGSRLALALHRAGWRRHQYLASIARYDHRVTTYEVENDLRLVGWIWAHMGDHFQIHVGRLAIECNN